MEVLRGSGAVTIEAGEVDRGAGKAERVVVDVGTGDARWAYRLARANPSWLVIGIDPAKDRLRDIALRTSRKPAKGGIENLWLVPTDVEHAPRELHGLADELHILLPWGTLLRGAVLGDAALLGHVRALAAAGADVDLVLGADIWDEPVPLEIRDLPTVGLDYVSSQLTPRYARAGLPIDHVELLGEGEWRALPSSWARRLAHGRHAPKFVRIIAHAADPEDPGL